MTDLQIHQMFAAATTIAVCASIMLLAWRVKRLSDRAERDGRDRREVVCRNLDCPFHNTDSFTCALDETQLDKDGQCMNASNVPGK